MARRSGTSSSRSRRAIRTTSGRASTCSTCSRTPPATCTWGTRRRTRSATSSRATGASRASTCCTRSAGTRSACPPRTRRSSAAPTRATGPTPTSSSRRQSMRRYAASFDWDRDAAHERPRVLQVEPVAVPQAVREGPRVPQGQLGQLVPRYDQTVLANEQVRRRALRALRQHRRQEEAHPVVLQDHRLRRPAARRPEPARGHLAVEGASRCSATGSDARPAPTSTS